MFAFSNVNDSCYLFYFIFRPNGLVERIWLFKTKTETKFKLKLVNDSYLITLKNIFIY